MFGEFDGQGEHGYGVVRHPGGAVGLVQPEAGRQVAKGESVCVVDSVKAASDVYTPVSGEVLEPNAALVDAPELVNSDAEGEGWLFKVAIADTGELAELMDRTAYDAYVAEL